MLGAHTNSLLRSGSVAALIGIALVSSEVPAAATQVDCPNGEVIVLDGEQVCFPSVSGPIPARGHPIT